MDKYALVLDSYDYIPDLIVQIGKDINLSGIDDHRFDGIVSSEKLVSVLKEFIEDLITHNPEAFSNLMYRVDISEEQIRGLSHIQLTDLVDEISLLVLKREIQKVYYRKKYSK